MLCQSYCRHGGRCEKFSGHDGLHDSSYCTWTDTEAVTRQRADAVLSQTERGREFLETFQPLADMIESQLEDD